jgi:pyruvate formate lyase activating enzyme
MPRDERRIAGDDLPPATIVALADKFSCRSISYTYTEPTVYFEYAYDTARRAREARIANVFVTNGYTGPEALTAIGPYLDAANIDLKSFSDRFYHSVCGAKLQPVLDTITLYHKLGIWIEITTLIIPGHNDSDDELREIARFLKGLDERIPWHISAFHPTYRLTDARRTPVSTLMRAREIGLGEGLRYVYQGNMPGEEGENTFCYRCQQPLIQRLGFTITHNRVTDGACPHCKAAIDGVGM